MITYTDQYVYRFQNQKYINSTHTPYNSFYWVKQNDVSGLEHKY